MQFFINWKIVYTISDDIKHSIKSIKNYFPEKLNKYARLLIINN